MPPTAPSADLKGPEMARERSTLPGIEAHPHARAVLGPALAPGGGPRTPTCSTARRARASGRWRARSRRRCWRTARADPAAVAERVARGSHPDLTWVTPSGAAEMLVGDIEEPVVAAATRTPFESARRVFVIEAADAMNDQAANRMLKTLEEPPRVRAPAAAERPPRGRAGDDRLALPARSLRPAAAGEDRGAA